MHLLTCITYIFGVRWDINEYIDSVWEGEMRLYIILVKSMSFGFTTWASYLTRLSFFDYNMGQIITFFS